MISCVMRLFVLTVLTGFSFQICSRFMRLTCEFQIEISAIQVPRQVLYAHCLPIKSSKRGSTKNITLLRSGLRGLDLCCRKIRLTSPIVVRARSSCIFLCSFLFSILSFCEIKLFVVVEDYADQKTRVLMSISSFGFFCLGASSHRLACFFVLASAGGIFFAPTESRPISGQIIQ